MFVRVQYILKKDKIKGNQNRTERKELSIILPAIYNTLTHADAFVKLIC